MESYSISDMKKLRKNTDYNRIVVCRGGGDLATGIIHRLTKAGLRVVCLESERPSSIRRQVCFSEAVYDGEAIVDDVKAVLVHDIEEIWCAWKKSEVPVLVDPAGECIEELKPVAVVDAIIAKKNLGTCKEMAPLTIGVGPGFTAGVDVDVVIESMRGHNLGRVIAEGMALANTGIPGKVGGYDKERVIYASRAGYMKNISRIGDLVEQGQTIAEIYEEQAMTGAYVAVEATLTGILRGLIRTGYYVTKGFKIADIDPRKEELENCFTISDKARCIAGSVLEVICSKIFEQETSYMNSGRNSDEA